MLKKNILSVFTIIIFIAQQSYSQQKLSYNMETPFFSKLHGYSFTVDKAIWVQEDSVTVKSKSDMDSKNSKKSLNYDYIFTLRKSKTDFPFIIVSPLYAGKNLFDDFKKEYVAKFNSTIVKNNDLLSNKISEVKLDVNSTIIDEKNKTLVSIVNVKTKEGLQLTQLNYICFNNKYTIQFMFNSLTKDFPELYKTKFKKIIETISVFPIIKL